MDTDQKSSRYQTIKLFCYNLHYGRVAQLGERFLRKEEVAGSIPVTSTKYHMGSYKRIALVLALASFLAAPSHAGKLDIALPSSVLLRPMPTDEGILFQTPWTPGNPLDLRGGSPEIQALSHAGYLAMDTVGLAENFRDFGRDNNATWATLGFALVRAVQAWTGYTMLKSNSFAGWSF